MMTGVRMNLSDVGGSQAMQQQQFLVRGVSGGNNTVSFDGLNLNSLLGDGATVPYFNDATVQEFSFQAGALDADTTAGGGRLNVIPKDGGNRFSGSGSWPTTANPGRATTSRRSCSTPASSRAARSSGCTTSMVRSAARSCGTSCGSCSRPGSMPSTTRFRASTSSTISTSSSRRCASHGR